MTTYGEIGECTPTVRARDCRVARHVTALERVGPSLARGGAMTRLLLASILCAMPAMAVAQETRAASITAEQADKATRLSPRTSRIGPRTFC